MAEVARLEVVLGGDSTKFEKAMSKAFDSLEKFEGKTKGLFDKLNSLSSSTRDIGKSFEKIGKEITRNITVPIMTAVTALMKLNNDFENAQRTIRVNTGATGQALSELTDNFENVFTSGAFAMGDTANAVADLSVMLGYVDTDLENISKKFLQLQKLTGTNINQLIKSGTQSMFAWEMDESAQKEAMDWYFKVFQSTGTEVDYIAQNMQKYANIFKGIGYDWKEASVMLGQFNKVGVNTELVLGSIRIGMGKMAKAGIKDTATAMDLVIKKIKEAENLADATKIANSIFGTRAGVEMASAIRKGAFDTGDLFSKVSGSDETIEKAYEESKTYLDKIKELFNELKVAFQPLGEQIATALEFIFPIFQKIILYVEKLVTAFNNLSPNTKELIVKFGLLTAGLGPVIFGLGKVFLYISYLSKGFAKLGSFILLVSKELLMFTSSIPLMITKLINPTTILIGLITALGAGIVYCVKNWYETKETINIWANAVLSIMQNLKVVALKVMGETVVGIGKLWNKGMDLINVDKLKVDEVKKSYNDAIDEANRKSDEYIGKAKESNLILKVNKKVKSNIEGVNYSKIDWDLIKFNKDMEKLKEDMKLDLDIATTTQDFSEIDKLLDELINKQEKAGKKTKTEAERIAEYMGKIKDSFLSARDSIKDYINYFDKFSRSNLRATSSYRLLQNAKMRDKALNEREQALNALAGRGISSEIMADLVKMDISRLGDIKGLSKMNDNQLKEWLKYQKSANQSAERQAITQVGNIELNVYNYNKDADDVAEVILRKLKAKGVTI